MSDRQSNFVWYELMTDDAASAQSFYERVVGWKGADAGMEGMSYTIFSAGKAMVAGLMTLPEEVKASGARPAWFGYVGVEDVDAETARVAGAGGAIHHPPDDIPNVGRFSVVADPDGAVICLFQPKGGEAPPRPAPGTPGHVGWHELYAGDGAAAMSFYADLFGWRETETMDMGEMGVYRLFAPAAGADAIGGMMTKTPQMPMPFWLYYFNVDAIDAAAARVSAAGGHVLMGPIEVPGGGWIVQCSDREGAMFALFGPKR